METLPATGGAVAAAGAIAKPGGGVDPAGVGAGNGELRRCCEGEHEKNTRLFGQQQLGSYSNGVRTRCTTIAKTS